ncbi:MAG: branched-chain amino acid ABC transporter permease [Streptosporangiales bacterium]|nr:branched-chain amino acid ABC transporter permease [Streptosporangiales bacterium]
MSGEYLLTQVLNGVSLGALLFFLAGGLTLIFGLMRIVNLAHGGFYLAGGYIGFATVTATGNFWLAFLAAGASIALLGLFTERALLRRLRGQELPEVLLTVGVATVLGDLALAVWGGDPKSVDPPAAIGGTLQLGELPYPTFRIFVVALAVVVGLGLFYLERRTRLGAIVRAGVDDRETIQALGIDINRVFTGVFIVGSLLAGVAGVIGSSFLGLLPGGDVEILLLSLVVVIIGGLGSLPGAALGSLIVGLVQAFGTSELPQLATFIIFAPMALILILRPSGLMGRPI